MKQVDANENSELVGVHSNQAGPQNDGELEERDAAPSSIQRAPDGRMSTYHRLIEACKLKELATIGAILAGRPELANQRDKHNRTLLHYAAILLIDDASVTASVDKQQPRQLKQQSQRRHSQANNRNKLQQQELPSAENSIECFNYLTDRCDLKLWWQQDLDGLSILHLAVISSNVPLVKHIIYEHPYSIKYPLVCTLDNELHSPLHWAVITNNLDCVSLLIGYAGAKLAHESDINGATPLHYATQTSDYPKYRQQLRLMLRSVGQHQEHPKAKQQGNSSKASQERLSGEKDVTNDGSSEEQIAAAVPKLGDLSTAGAAGAHQKGLEILEYLIRLPQIDLECKDKDRRTPLLWAASSGNRDAIVLLVSNGADVSSHDINRLGALHCAASHGYTDCLECLLALSNGSSAAGGAGQLVNQPDNLSCTPLFYAVLSGNIDCVETLLERGAKQDWQDTKGRTAAHFAALKGQLNSLKLMHERGANLWLPNKQGDLPLHYAIKSGRQQVVRWLLEHSPYERAVNAINNCGRAPIHLAIQKDNLALAEYLIRCGANLNQLVKVRDKTGSAANRQSAVAAPQLESGSVHQTKAGGQYHYETALDMAHNLGHKDCLRLLADQQALPAIQVIRNRAGQSASFPPRATPMGNVRSLFDLQSVDGPSPIGFETSCSSVSPSTNLASSSGQRIPKLTRPQPDSLPQTDSTGSSALSQNSLTSVRGQQQQQQQQQHRQQYYSKPLSKQQRQQALAGRPTGENTVANEPPTMMTTSVAATGATGVPLPTTANEPAVADHDSAAPTRQSGPHGSKRPYRGGISYNNELINASIKCKVYGAGLEDHASRRSHANHRSFPQENAAGPARDATGSGAARHPMLAGRSAQSAPIGGAHGGVGVSGGGGPEIITHVNVYTSPCPHCVHHKLDQCVQCSMESQLGPRKLEQQVSQATTGEQSAFYSDETSDATTESEDIERSLDVHHLPSLTQQQQQQQQMQMRGSHQQPATSQSASSFARGQQLRHFQAPSGRGSQQTEQHLPVILSDREQSQSAASQSPEDDHLQQQQQQQQQQEEEDEEAQQARKRPPAHGGVSSAGQEPRFDRSQRSRASYRVDKYRDHVRSPVAEYIHGTGYSSPTREHQHYQDQAASSRPVSLNRALDGRPSKTHYAGSHRLSDYSQVKSKVDSHREPGDEHMRSKSMSTLPSTQLSHVAHHHHPPPHQHIQRRDQHHHQRSPAAPSSPQRSCSRQTIIKTRRLSVDSVELASSVEKSIRKYKQETKLFEELQNLKRSQIRSGRANEALLVKRLIEHFRQDSQLDLIGLDVYHGPYTYKSYERFLYDQLRKLSHSNCAKLGRHFRQLADQFDGYLDDDLRADLELRRVIDGAGGGAGDEDDERESDDAPDESYIIEPSGALEEIRVRRSRHQTDPSPSAADEEDDSYDENAVKREKLGKEIQRELIHRASFQDDQGGLTKTQASKDQDLEKGEQPELREKPQTASSAASSRRSSIEVEREKLLGLPLRVQSKEEAEEESAEADEKAVAPAAGNVEEEADSLSSSILVDALGNLSRSGSPTLRLLDSSGARNESQAAVAKPVEEEMEGEAAEPASPPAMGAAGRRRSVVNIGNKLEVIYHDVAIEIDPAADSDRESMAASEQEQQPEASSGRDRLEDLEELEEDRGALVSSADFDAEEGGESVAGDTRAVDSEKHGEKDEQEATATEKQGEEEQSTTGGSRRESEEEEEPTSVPASTALRRQSSAQEELERLASAGSSGVGSIDSLLARTRSEASNRRASSPLVAKPTTPTISSSATVVDPARSHRSNSVGRPELVEAKRVFTGYDLDEMRRSRLRRTPTPLAETSVEHALPSEEGIADEVPISETATEAGGGRDGDQQDRSARRGQEERAAVSVTPTREAGERGATEGPLGPREQPAKQAKRQPVSPTRRRLEPSRVPPKGTYELRVPIEEVKERWARVKAEQRDGRRGARKPEMIKGGQQRATSLEDGDEGAASLTKSQPSLQAAEVETATPSDHHSNYILLYEINTGAKVRSRGLASTAGRQSAVGSQAAESTEQQHRSADQAALRSGFWCHRRAVKIVDVRTLKRTLSLPESLIYSNDLLKRFNILKL